MLAASTPGSLTDPIASIADDSIATGIIGFWIALTTLFVGFSLVMLVVTRRASYGDTMTRQLSRDVNLELPADLLSSVRNQLMWRLRGSIVGGLAGFVGLLVIVQPWEPRAAAGLEVSLAGLSAVFFGNQSGAAIGGMLARRQSVSSVRTARLEPITHRELVAPLWRSLTAISAGIGVAATLAFALVSATYEQSQPGFVAEVPMLAAAAALTAVIAASLPHIARRLAASRALRGDDHALAWSDALAARTIRDLCLGLTWAGFAITSSVLASIGRLAPDEGQQLVSQIQAVGSTLAVLAAITVLIVVLVTMPDRHLQRTVWPEFAMDAPQSRRDAQ